MNNGLEHIDDLIAKVLANEAGREEMDRLQSWVQASPANKDYFDESKKLFAQVDDFKITHQVDSVKAWEKLNLRISMEPAAAAETKVIPLFRRPLVLRVAASLLLITTLALLANYFLNNNQPVPVILMAQQKVSEQKLPDGSKVTLNKNSELAYVLNDKNVREIKLKGEAYFEVVHNEASPFEITIDEVVIKDIGTAFNVKALPGSNSIEVLVESGEVYFYSASDKGLNLVKGEKALYDKTTKKFSKVIPDPVENTLSYKSRVFHFEASPLREVIRQLNAIYGSNIALSDERLGNCLLKTDFNDESIDTVIDIIAETLDLEVEKSGEKIVLKGQPCTE